MRAIYVALIILCINIGMNVVVIADIFGTSNMYYESELLDEARTRSNVTVSNIPVVRQIEQATTVFDSVAYIFNMLTLNWIKSLAPSFIAENIVFTSFIDLCNLLLVFLISVAVADILTQRQSLA